MKTKKQKKTKYYFGIDASLTSTGIVFANKKCNRIETQLITTKSADQIELRLYQIYQTIYVAIKALGPHIKLLSAAIEGLAVRGGGQRTLQLAGLHYYIRTNLAVDFPLLRVAVIPPTSLKKYISDNGRCDKDRMMLCCYKRWKFDSENSDICDAFSLTRFLCENKKNIKKEWWLK
jgi:Holliday junction resolvasome RuvABC endonuclease subunit